MPQPLSPVVDQLRADILDPDRLVRAVASGRRKGARPDFRRAEFRWVDISDGRRLQVVTYDERQAFTRNLAGTAAAGAVEELLAQPYGNWHVETVGGTTQVRVTKSGEAQVHRDAAPRLVDRSHDRTKQRLLDPADAVLQAVGISDRSGHVKPSRRDKYRQVEEFVRALDPVVDSAREAAGGKTVRIADLGCGNAYLSFAAYRWFERQGIDASLVGVDIKAPARERNAQIAQALGWTSAIRFLQGTISAAAVDPAPHLVLALHACDTATDDALARAVEWESPVVLAAPCCHHDIQRQLGAAIPAPYGPLVRHGILRERFADVLTDALRATILRLLGYRVEVIEFVDSAHTPRNTLLRAIRTGAPPHAALVREYRDLIGSWDVEPALAVRLADRLQPVLDQSDG